MVTGDDEGERRSMMGCLDKGFTIQVQDGLALGQGLIRMLACLTNYHLHWSQLGKMERWSREARGVFQAALDKRCLVF